MTESPSQKSREFYLIRAVRNSFIELSTHPEDQNHTETSDGIPSCASINRIQVESGRLVESHGVRGEDEMKKSSYDPEAFLARTQDVMIIFTDGERKNLAETLEKFDIWHKKVLSEAS